LLERGKKRAIWANTLVRLAETLGCSLDYLGGLTDDPTPRARARRKRPSLADAEETPWTRAGGERRRVKRS
jgi:transcriptional regulator with XRE-family HTH domain